jgi:hypothetical protein
MKLTLTALAFGFAVLSTSALVSSPVLASGADDGAKSRLRCLLCSDDAGQDRERQNESNSDNKRGDDGGRGGNDDGPDRD